jgi:DNA sulfur modification protein DndD
MKFKKIKFKNYRCFVDGELNFNENQKKHINLILGNNGAGKTEVLFSFWWVLYGFDFTKLQNKEASPYALNSSLYKDLEAGLIREAECRVVLELENDNTTYVVERFAKYYKTKQNKIDVDETQFVRYYKPNHELSLPIITPKNEESNLLNRIVPKRILHGIVFDGERMKKLSSVDRSSVNAIEGVISDITNIELLDLCFRTYQSLEAAANKRAKEINRRKGKDTVAQLISRIEENTNQLNNKKSLLQGISTELKQAKIEAEDVSNQLEDIKEIRDLQIKRKNLEEQVKAMEERRSTLLNTFPSTMKFGYVLCSQKLFNDIKGLLTQYDVPAELTVPAVNNILKRRTCICGKCWTPEMRMCLETLKKTLPPDNINSTLGEMTRQKELDCKEIRDNIIKESNKLTDCDDEIEETNKKISSFTAQISGSGIENAEKLEKRRQELERVIAVNENKIEEYNQNINELVETIETDKKTLSSYENNDTELKRVNAEIRFIDKCLKAVERIKVVNQKTALKTINEKLSEAYALLSDDADMGRRLCILQYSKDPRMVSYFEEKLNQTIDEMKRNGQYKNLKDKGICEEEIREMAILKCELPNSTGQSKMNTFAFVKAILDYSNKKRTNEIIELTKEYPLLIDAPFGDIFDKNLEKSAIALNDFTNQIILMVAKDSYLSVENYIKNHISTVHVFKKVENKDKSIISPYKLEDI